jgi:hypothetical protein
MWVLSPPQFGSGCTAILLCGKYHGCVSHHEMGVHPITFVSMGHYWFSTMKGGINWSRTHVRLPWESAHQLEFATILAASGLLRDDAVRNKLQTVLMQCHPSTQVLQASSD